MWLYATPLLWVVAIVLLVVAVIRAGLVGRVLALLGLVVFVTPVVLVAWFVVRPDLVWSSNPLDRFFMDEFDSRTLQDPKSLVPIVFAVGTSRDQVVETLLSSGFARDSGREEEESELWFMKAGPNSIVCAVSFNVQAEFEGPGLRDALAHHWATCL
jgi:hypothetical protein